MGISEGCWKGSKFHEENNEGYKKRRNFYLMTTSLLVSVSEELGQWSRLIQRKNILVYMLRQPKRNFPR